ncbi:MAG: hypothetical protein H5U03_10075, partial [Clostridia bacterium]|nr:hypothetical protein [Clostridia bacterium]
RAEAGIRPAFEIRHPELSLNILENAKGEKLLVAINHSDIPLEEDVCSQKVLNRVVDIESGDELEIQGSKFRLPLGPWGVRVLKIEPRSGASNPMGETR